MANRVVHFEIEATDLNRAKNFYQNAFGWEMEEWGAEYGDYLTVKTGDPKKPTGINGGIYRMNKKKELNAYSCVIAVDSIDKAMRAVKTAGGKILKEKPDDIPKVGLYMPCLDTEGNRFTLLQPSSDMAP